MTLSILIITFIIFKIYKDMYSFFLKYTNKIRMNIVPYSDQYIDGTNTYPLVDYIDDEISIVNNDAITNSNNLIIYNNISSNNLATYTTSTSNIIVTNINKLIKEELEYITTPVVATLKHTYVYNSNLAGEIRFYTASTNAFITSGMPTYRTKVDVDGKLKIYYIYNAGINLTYGSGFVDIVDSIVGLNAADINFNIAILGLQAEVTFNDQYVKQEIRNLQIGLYSTTTVSEANQAIINQVMNNFRFNPLNATTASALYNDIRNAYYSGNITFLSRISNAIAFRINANPAVAFYLGVGGLAFSAIVGALSADRYAQVILGQIKANITSNVSITSNIRNDLLSSNQDQIEYAYLDYASNLYNVSYYQGFLNSNTASAQFINILNNSNLNTYNITLNGNNINNIFLNQNGGSLYNTLVFQKASSGDPIQGYFGGLGDRVVYQASTTTTDYTCATGINNTTKNMWNNVSSNYGYDWYFAGIKMMSLNSNYLNYSNGIINCKDINVNGASIPTISRNTILSSTPNVSKKYLIEFTCATSILMPNSVTYYKRDIDLRLYTQNLTIPNPSSPYRIFKIKVWIKSGYFELSSVGNYNVLEYTIYQSLQSQSAPPGSAGENLYAIGTPQNPALNSITAGQISLVRTANYNYLSVLSVANNTVCQAIISDELF